MNSEIIIAPAAFGLMGYIVFIILRWRQSKYRLNVQLKLIEKVRSADELVQFAGTESGNRFLDSFSTEPVADTSNRILGGINKGVILALTGFVLLFLRGIANEIESRAAITIFGAIIASVGVGYLVATGLSYKLAKKWGAIVEKEGGEV